MKSFIFSISPFLLLAAVLLRLSAALPSPEEKSGSHGAKISQVVELEAQAEVESAFSATSLRSKAGILGISLKSSPAWRPVKALGLNPIRPGPGLPSLQSLGLSWDDLIKPVEGSEGVTPYSIPVVEKRFEPQCVWSNRIETSPASWCYNYLNRLGGMSCTVPPAGVRFCTAGSVSWYGSTVNGKTSSSTCANVAAGGQWVLRYCLDGDVPSTVKWQVEGANAAWNNGNLVVRIKK